MEGQQPSNQKQSNDDTKKHAEDSFAHYKPHSFGDKLALRLVKLLRFIADAFFAKRYGHRAVVLETVAAVPGMVGGAMLHLRSLRRLEDDKGWIHTLLDEAENERMHLMTFIEIAKPSRFERFLVITTQIIFYLSYFIIYLLSPKSAHRVVGYLEEEAVVSYTEYLKLIESGAIDNIDAPKIAIDYWKLPLSSKLSDVIKVIRADEMSHREVNHLIADKIKGNSPKIQLHSDMSEETVSNLKAYEKREFPH